MATFEEGFLYPLYLLIIGSGVLGIAVALFTHFLEGRRQKQANELEDRRQKQQNELEDRRKEREFEVENHRKELEVKVDIVSKMLEVYGSVSAKPFLSSMRGEPISNIDEVLEKFYVDAYIVDSMLDSYYSSKPDILARWANFFRGYVPFLDATSLYVKDRTDDEKIQLECHLKDVKKYFSEIVGNFCTVGDNKEIKWDGLNTDMPYDKVLRTKINDLYGDRVSEIYKDVLKLPIKVF